MNQYRKRANTAPAALYYDTPDTDILYIKSRLNEYEGRPEERLVFKSGPSILNSTGTDDTLKRITDKVNVIGDSGKGEVNDAILLSLPYSNDIDCVMTQKNLNDKVEPTLLSDKKEIEKIIVDISKLTDHRYVNMLRYKARTNAIVMCDINDEITMDKYMCRDLFERSVKTGETIEQEVKYNNNGVESIVSIKTEDYIIDGNVNLDETMRLRQNEIDNEINNKFGNGNIEKLEEDGDEDLNNKLLAIRAEVLSCIEFTNDKSATLEITSLGINKKNNKQLATVDTNDNIPQINKDIVYKNLSANYLNLIPERANQVKRKALKMDLTNTPEEIAKYFAQMTDYNMLIVADNIEGDRFGHAFTNLKINDENRKTQINHKLVLRSARIYELLKQVNSTSLYTMCFAFLNQICNGDAVVKLNCVPSLLYLTLCYIRERELFRLYMANTTGIEEADVLSQIKRCLTLPFLSSALIYLKPEYVIQILDELHVNEMTSSGMFYNGLKQGLTEGLDDEKLQVTSTDILFKNQGATFKNNIIKNAIDAGEQCLVLKNALTVFNCNSAFDQPTEAEYNLAIGGPMLCNTIDNAKREYKRSIIDRSANGTKIEGGILTAVGGSGSSLMIPLYRIQNGGRMTLERATELISDSQIANIEDVNILRNAFRLAETQKEVLNMEMIKLQRDKNDFEGDKNQMLEQIRELENAVLITQNNYITSTSEQRNQLELFNAKVLQAEKEKEDLRQKGLLCESEIRDLNKEIANLNSLTIQLRDAVTEKESKLNEYIETNNILKNSLSQRDNKTFGDIVVLKETIAENMKNINSLQGEIQKLKNLGGENINEMRRMREKNNHIEDELKKNKIELELSEMKVESLENEADRLRIKIDENSKNYINEKTRLQTEFNRNIQEKDILISANEKNFLVRENELKEKIKEYTKKIGEYDVKLRQIEEGWKETVSDVDRMLMEMRPYLDLDIFIKISENRNNIMKEMKEKIIEMNETNKTIKKERGTMKDKIEELKGETSSYKMEIQNLKTKLEQSEYSILVVSRELAEAKQKYKDVELKIEQIKKSSRDFNDKYEEAEFEIKGLKNKLELREMELRTTQQQKESLNEDKEREVDEIKILKNEILNKEKALQEEVNFNRELMKQGSMTEAIYKEKIDQLKDELEEMNNKLIDRNGKIKELLDKINTYEKQIFEYADKLMKLEGERDVLKKMKEDIENEYKTLEKRYSLERESAQKQLKEATDLLSKMEETGKGSVLEKAELNGKLDTLTIEISRLKKEIEGNRKIQESMDATRIKELTTARETTNKLEESKEILERRIKEKNEEINMLKEKIITGSGERSATIQILEMIQSLPENTKYLKGYDTVEKPMKTEEMIDNGFDVTNLYGPSLNDIKKSEWFYDSNPQGLKAKQLILDYIAGDAKKKLKFQKSNFDNRIYYCSQMKVKAISKKRKTPYKNNTGSRGISEAIKARTASVEKKEIVIQPDGSAIISETRGMNEIQQLLDGDDKMYQNIYRLLSPIAQNNIDTILCRILSGAGGSKKSQELLILYREGRINGAKIAYILDKLEGGQKYFTTLKNTIPSYGGSEESKRAEVISFIKSNELTPTDLKSLCYKHNMIIELYPWAGADGTVDASTLPSEMITKLHRIAEIYQKSAYDKAGLKKLIMYYPLFLILLNKIKSNI